MQRFSLTNAISDHQFQSSPVPEDGCNQKLRYSSAELLFVSILTRPGGRVQPAPAHRPTAQPEFQSSPVPKDGCNTSTHHHGKAAGSFNPHPSRRTGATLATCRCTPASSVVSILTRPGGRVQRR